MAWTRLRRALAAGIGLAALAATTPAASAAAEVTKQPLAFDVLTGPAGDVPCRIVADLYTPAGASAAAPVPAVLATNGFGGSKDDFDRLGPAYASRGYAFLAYSGLGFGGSSCKITLDDPDYDGRAGSQLVSFLGGTKAATDGTTIDYIVKDGPGDPRVGMTGGSYGGQIQFAVAGVDARVDALNPQITWNDLEYSLAGNNTDFASGVTSRTPGVAKLDWPTLFSGVGVAGGLQAVLTSGDTSHLGACPNFADQVCPGLVQAAARGYADPETSAFLRHASVSTYMDRIKIPTFIAQGQHDTLFDLQEAVATYQALRAQGTPVKLLFRSAGHSGGGLGTAESNATDLEQAYESRMTLQWFDWYLRDRGTAPKLDFSFLRDWVPYEGDAAPAVGTTPSYPAGTPVTVELPGTMALASLPVGLSTTGPAFADVPATPPLPGSEAAIDGPALTTDLEVAGVPSMTFTVDAPAHAASQGSPEGKLVLFARLEDVAPDGSSSVPGDIVSAIRVADVTKPVTVELPGIVHRFAAGHRLRVAVSTGHALRRGNVTPGPVTVSKVALTLPRLGAVAGPTGSGVNGTTPYTPSPNAPAAQPDGAGRRPTAEQPSTTCVRRRKLTVRFKRPRGGKVRRITVRVNGKRVRAKRRARTRTLVVRRLPATRRVRVKVVVRTTKGEVRRTTRRYALCR